MTDIARLGIQFDSSGAVKASKDMDRVSSSAKRAETSTKNMGQEARAASASMNHLGNAMGAMNARNRGAIGGLRGLGLQLNQVAQVGGMTGNWANALAVQLPDILLNLGTLGVFAGIAAGAMIPLVNTLMDGEAAAKRLNDDIDSLSGAVDSYGKAAMAARDGNFGLEESFGKITFAARTTLMQLQEFEKLAALAEIKRLSEEITSTFNNLSSRRLSETLGISELGKDFRESNIAWQDLSETLKSDLGDLNSLFDEFQATEGMKEKADVGRELLAQYTKLAEEVDGINEEERAFIENLSKAIIEMDKMASIDIESGIRGASVAAGDLARQMGNAAEEAIVMIQAVEQARSNAILSMTGDFMQGNLDGGRGQDPRGFDDPSLAAIDPGGANADAARREAERRARDLADAQSALASLRGGGRGSQGDRSREGEFDLAAAAKREREALAALRKSERAGVSEAKKELREAQREAQELYESTRTKSETYADSLVKIEELYERGLITTDTYSRATRQLGDEYTGVADKIETARTAGEDFFVSILNRSKSAKDAIADLASEIGNMFLRSGVNGAFDIIGASLGLPAKAMGGPVTAGSAYQVNEHLGGGNREIFVPSQSGGVLNVQQAQEALRGGNGVQLNFSPVIDARDADQAAVARLEAGLQRMMAEFEPKVIQALRAAKTNNVAI